MIYDKIGFKQVSSSLKITTCFGNIFMLSFSNQKSLKTLIICVTVVWGAVCDFSIFLITATNSSDVCNETSLSASQRRKTLEAEMHNLKLRETARKVYHAQQALQSFQTSTPGNWSTFWRFSSSLTVFNAQPLRLASLCSQLAGACTKKFCFIQNTLRE